MPFSKSLCRSIGVKLNNNYGTERANRHRCRFSRHFRFAPAWVLHQARFVRDVNGIEAVTHTGDGCKSRMQLFE